MEPWAGPAHFSTADTLRLNDGGQFDARTPANSLLTVAPVEAFGFLGNAPAPITINRCDSGIAEGPPLSCRCAGANSRRMAQSPPAFGMRLRTPGGS
jgi:hypothetical protein